MRLYHSVRGLAACLGAVVSLGSMACGGSSQPPPKPKPTITVSPASIAVIPAANVTAHFTATVSDDTSVTWKVTGTGCGSITQDGIYTTPTAAAAGCAVVAESSTDATASGSATVTLYSAPDMTNDDLDAAFGTTPLYQGSGTGYAVQITGISLASDTQKLYVAVQFESTNGTTIPGGNLLYLLVDDVDVATGQSDFSAGGTFVAISSDLGLTNTANANIDFAAVNYICNDVGNDSPCLGDPGIFQSNIMAHSGYGANSMTVSGNTVTPVDQSANIQEQSSSTGAAAGLLFKYAIPYASINSHTASGHRVVVYALYGSEPVPYSVHSMAPAPDATQSAYMDNPTRTNTAGMQGGLEDFSFTTPPPSYTLE
jgi:hypothetical protein